MAKGLTLGLVAILSCGASCFEGCACTPATPTSDAGMRADASPLRGDVGVDSSTGTRPPLAPCNETSECAPAPGVACRTSVAGGACTRRCEADADCGPGATCAENICLWACTTGSGAGECVAHAGACFDSGTTAPFCVPICYAAGREPPGYPPCGPGLVCDPYSSTCTASPEVGAENGAPCRDGVECRGGDCFLEDLPAPTGFLDGTCISYGVQPSADAYLPGAPLPQGSCPDGSAVMPGFASRFYGDLAICFRACRTNDECRAGYACTHFEAPDAPFANGLCIPIDCTTVACPAGSACTGDSAWLGHAVCARTP